MVSRPVAAMRMLIGVVPQVDFGTGAGGGCGIVRCPAKRAVLAFIMPYGRLVCHGFVFVIDCA